MTKPIRPKDVANTYMHRFKYFIPNITGYQRAARTVNGTADEGIYKLLPINVYDERCMTAVEMRAFNVMEYHALPDIELVRMGEVNILQDIYQGPNWEHDTLMVCPMLAIPGALLGVYCFDTFAIDNRLGEGDNVLYAKHAFSPRWAPLTDLAALSK